MTYNQLSDQEIQAVKDLLKKEVTCEITTLVKEVLPALVNAPDAFNYASPDQYSHLVTRYPSEVQIREYIEGSNQEFRYVDEGTEDETVGIWDNTIDEWVVDPKYIDEVDAIEAYQEDYAYELEYLQQDIKQYWIVTEYLGNILRDEGEVTEPDFFRHYIWGRTKDTYDLEQDDVIQHIYRIHFNLFLGS